MWQEEFVIEYESNEHEVLAAKDYLSVLLLSSNIQERTIYPTHIKIGTGNCMAPYSKLWYLASVINDTHTGLDEVGVYYRGDCIHTITFGDMTFVGITRLNPRDQFIKKAARKKARLRALRTIGRYVEGRRDMMSMVALKYKGNYEEYITCIMDEDISPLPNYMTKVVLYDVE